MSKFIAVQVPDGTGRTLKNLEIDEAATPRDIKRSLRLPNQVVLAKLSDPTNVFGEDEPIHDKVGQGEKLIADVPADVGTSPFFQVVWQVVKFFYLVCRVVYQSITAPNTDLKGGAAKAAPSRVVPVQRGKASSITTHSQTTQVTAQAIPLWQKRQWQKRGRSLYGYFRTPLGAVKGRIDAASSRYPQFFVVKPPKSLKSHSHSACFRHRGNGTYWIHFNGHMSSVDAGIVAVERILAQCLASK